MGEVYRARDATLDRDVAVKVLAGSSAADADRLVRFGREARLLASLNHPNIGSIYGIEEAAGTPALILELVEGVTLAERIARGPMPPAETVAVARQIGAALEAASERGIIHRDLKPANVKIRPDGTVKVLDFGVAKMLARDSVDLADSPTVSATGTRAGAVVGTASYMSPEQASGRAADRRTDIWAFGCVLYEMLSGRRAFTGDRFTEILARVLERDPDFDVLPAATPPALRRLVQRCLRKDPRERLQHIGDARLDLEEIASQPSDSTGAAGLRDAAPRPASARRIAKLAVGAVAIAGLGALAGWSVSRGGATDTRSARVDVVFPPDEEVVNTVGTPAIISPDGQRIAYAARTQEGTFLYVRSLDNFEPTRLPGTDGASAPFFSPDSQWLGFCAGGRLLKTRVSGGGPAAIGDCRGLLLGASWGPDDTIVYSDTTVTGLWRVPARGGRATPVTDPNVPMNAGHRFPYQLPDGSGTLFSTRSPDGRSQLGLLRTGTQTWDVLAEADGRFSGMKYLPTGQLLFGQAGTIKVAPFDLSTGRLTGASRTVIDDVASSPTSGHVYLSVSDTGTLIYVPASAAEPDFGLAWLDAMGDVREFAEVLGGFGSMRLSPDGSRLAVGVRVAALLDPWVYDVASGRGVRLTRGTEADFPVWAPDGTRVAVGMGHTLGVLAADGSGAPERLVERGGTVVPLSWSREAPAGDRIVFAQIDDDGHSDVFVMSVTSREVAPLLTSTANESDAVVSPNGQWLAYVSDETGADEVYLQSFPDAGRKNRVSRAGGDTPRWSAAGDELFYRNGSTILVAQVDERGRPGIAKSVVEAPPGVSLDAGFDVGPDGRRFVVSAGSLNSQTGAATRVRVLFHWSPPGDNRQSGR